MLTEGELFAEYDPTEREKLRVARDLAAYRVVGHLNAAINRLKSGESALALSILEEAKHKYEVAEKKLDQFDRKKENSAHVRHTNIDSVA